MKKLIDYFASIVRAFRRTEHKGPGLTLGLAVIPVALGLACYITYPFSDEIARKTLSISSLSPIQKSNIELAAGALNGVVLKPGQEFSFNRVVGPRTVARGYRAAPSYLGPESPATVGGGVCLMSSAVYQAALEAGCQIDERVPHLRTIKTVPAGLDATVWYGQADLRFKNDLKFPIQITTSWSNQSVAVCLLGKRDSSSKPVRLQRIVSRQTPREMVVELLREQGTNVALISRDRYCISR